MPAEQGEIVNKIKQSEKLVTIDLQKYFEPTPISELDLEQFLYEGLILKEEEFRSSLEEFDWQQFEGHYLGVHCSTDAIISKWAYMIVAQHAYGIVKEVFYGRKEDILPELYKRKLEGVDWEKYRNKFVILKGCSDKEKPVPASVYLHATKKLLPFVKKLMYGEACSNVPVYRG